MYQWVVGVGAWWVTSHLVELLRLRATDVVMRPIAITLLDEGEVNEKFEVHGNYLQMLYYYMGSTKVLLKH